MNIKGNIINLKKVDYVECFNEIDKYILHFIFSSGKELSIDFRKEKEYREFQKKIIELI